MIYGERISISIVGPASDEAADRLYSSDISRLAYKLGGEIIRHLTKFRRLFEPIKLKWLAAKLGCTESSASKAIRELVQAGVIGWRSSRGQDAASYIALAPHYLPTSNMSDMDATNMSTTDIPEQKMNTRVKQEREPANLTSIPAGTDVSPHGSSSSSPDDVRTTRTTPGQDQAQDGRDAPPAGAEGSGYVPWEVLDGSADETMDDPAVGAVESLTPAETHEEDSRFAADRLAQHLFHGLPDPWTCRLMYRRFLKVTIGMSTQVLQQALLGKPARTIDNPAAYALTWIASAEERAKYALAV